jgi:hypothetical protein
MSRAVTQDWVNELTFMQQSVLLCAVRGPDGIDKFNPIKPMVRWYRRCVLLSALDGKVLLTPYEPGGGSFTGPSCDGCLMTSLGPVRADLLGKTCDWVPEMNKRVDDLMRTMDEMPIHYWLHLMHAFEIVGYKHSDSKIGEWFKQVYLRMVAAMHLFPETVEQLDARLGDSREGWLARGDAAIDKDTVG